LLFLVHSCMKVALLSTTDLHQVDLWRRQRTKSSLLHMVRCLFSLSPSPDINNLSSSFFNQSNKIRLSIDVVCLVVTSFFSLSPSVLFFFSLKAKMSSTHFIYFTYTTNSPSSPYIYILPSMQSIFIPVRIFQERRKKREITI
jgi:hypothetical protein